MTVLHRLRHIRYVLLTLLLFVGVTAASLCLYQTNPHQQTTPLIPSLFSRDSPLSALGIASIFAALFGWAYRTISQRMSVVNSISSDIYSILRASAALFVVQNIINMHRDADCKSYAYLISRDEYSLVGRITLGDIGFLNQNAIKRINGFYITLRAYKDRAIMLSEWCKANTSHGAIESDRLDEFRSLTVTLVYYAFSCIENGRIALYELLGNSELANEGIFLALAQDLRAITFLLMEQNDKAIKEYVKIRLRERTEFSQSAEQFKKRGPRIRDPKENYFFDGYKDARARLVSYMKELDDKDYKPNLERLFGDNIRQLFPSNYFEAQGATGTTLLDEGDLIAHARRAT
jgi:hypothetical protein